MNSTIRNIAGVILGLFVGGIVNMGIINISGFVIAPPDGADVTTMGGLEAAMLLFEPKHFLMPFLAHAIGTLVGALIASLIAASHQFKLSLIIGFFFLFGGIAMVMSLPSPTWFTIVDLVGAYIPMAWLGYKLSGKGKTTWN